MNASVSLPGYAADKCHGRDLPNTLRYMRARARVAAGLVTSKFTRLASITVLEIPVPCDDGPSSAVPRRMFAALAVPGLSMPDDGSCGVFQPLFCEALAE